MKIPAFFLYCVSCFSTISINNTALADDVYSLVLKKQEEKSKSRWTIEDWLEKRDKMRLMDLWFALHTPSPYEFYLGGAYQFASPPESGASNTASIGASKGWNVKAAAYASIIGLEAQYEFLERKKLIGLLHLRLFGYHVQATNITIDGGIKQELIGSSSFQNPLLGANLTAYLSKYAGVTFLYRYYFKATPNKLHKTYEGQHYEGGAFIDFSMLRVYGKFISEEVNKGQCGVAFGTQLFF